MKKLLLLLALMLIANPCIAADEWDKVVPVITNARINYPDDSQANNEALDRLLSNYREKMTAEYSSATALSVPAGQVVCSNSAGTIRKFRSNTSATSVGWADLDTGSEAASTRYYIYAVADADAATATFKISTSSSSPTGVTYYKKIGTFYNNSSSNIAEVTSYDKAYLGDFEAEKTLETTYQATYDILVVVRIIAQVDDTAVTAYIYSDDSASPSTVRQSVNESGTHINAGTVYNMVCPVKRGNYYKVSATNASASIYVLPLNERG